MNKRAYKLVEEKTIAVDKILESVMSVKDLTIKEKVWVIEGVIMNLAASLILQTIPMPEGETHDTMTETKFLAAMYVRRVGVIANITKHLERMYKQQRDAEIAKQTDTGAH